MLRPQTICAPCTWSTRAAATTRRWRPAWSSRCLAATPLTCRRPRRTPTSSASQTSRRGGGDGVGGRGGLPGRHTFLLPRCDASTCPLAPQVQFWSDRTQLMGQLGPGRAFGYALYHGAPGASNVPYRCGGWRDASVGKVRRGAGEGRQAHHAGLGAAALLAAAAPWAEGRLPPPPPPSAPARSAPTTPRGWARCGSWRRTRR
jgi:hypothetical protein